MTHEDDFKGYREPVLSVMRKYSVTVWCEVLVKTHDGEFEGLVLPRSETSDADHLVLKLGSGYNIGIRHDKIASKLAHSEKPPRREIRNRTPITSPPVAQAGRG